MLHHCEEFHEFDREAEPEAETPAEGTTTAAGETEGADAEGDVTMGASGSEPAPAAGSSTQPDAAASTTPTDNTLAPLVEAAPPTTPEGEAEKAAAAQMKKMEDKMREPYLHQAVATIGIALIAMGEEVGAEMSLRQFQHLVSPSCPKS